MKSRQIFLSLLLGVSVSAGPKLQRVMAKDLNKKFSVEDNTLELVPVKLLSGDKADGLEFENKVYAPLVKGKKIRISSFRFKKAIEGNFGLKIEINERAQKEISRLAKKYQNEKMAIIFNGKVVLVPDLKKVVKKDKFEFIAKRADQINNIFNEFKGA